MADICLSSPNSRSITARALRDFKTERKIHETQSSDSFINVSCGSLVCCGSTSSLCNLDVANITGCDIQKIVEAARTPMTEQHTAGCIAVADADGEVLFLQRQEGAAPNFCYIQNIGLAMMSLRTREISAATGLL